MRLPLKAPIVAPLLATAVVIPPLSFQQVTANDKSPGLLQLDVVNAYARFQVACPDCFRQGDADDALIFEVSVFRSEEACGYPNITINGVSPLASQAGSFGELSVPLNNQHSAELFWNSSCLITQSLSQNLSLPFPEQPAQAVTINIRTVDGEDILSAPGFTLSFEQSSNPRLLSISPLPDNKSGPLTYYEGWRHPVFWNVVDAKRSDGQRSLDDDIDELNALEAQVTEIQQAIKDKGRSVKERILQEIKYAHQEVEECSNTICIFKALLRQARMMVKMMCLRFRTCTSREYQEIKAQYLDHDDAGIARIKGGPQKFTGAAVPQTDQKETRPEFNEATVPRPTAKSSQTPLVIALEVLASVLGLAGLLSFLRRRLCCLRRRVERLSDREERLRAQEYRRSACRQAFKARCRAHKEWWSRLLCRGRQPIQDEEKRRLVESQEDILEKVMDEEIKQLVDGPDGDMYIVNLATSTTHAGPSQMTYMPGTRASVSRRGSLPDYRSRASSLRSGPPGYDSSDEAMGSFIADGLLRHVSGAHTPESSVVSVSPRISAETLRSIYSADQAPLYPPD